ncbi:hypothetical protein HK405_013825, partial [Cladochytrium tenue]
MPNGNNEDVAAAAGAIAAAAHAALAAATAALAAADPPERDADASYSELDAVAGLRETSCFHAPELPLPQPEVTAEGVEGQGGAGGSQPSVAVEDCNSGTASGPNSRPSGVGPFEAAAVATVVATSAAVDAPQTSLAVADKAGGFAQVSRSPTATVTLKYANEGSLDEEDDGPEEGELTDESDDLAGEDLPDDDIDEEDYSGAPEAGAPTSMTSVLPPGIAPDLQRIFLDGMVSDTRAAKLVPVDLFQRPATRLSQSLDNGDAQSDLELSDSGSSSSEEEAPAAKTPAATKRARNLVDFDDDEDDDDNTASAEPLRTKNELATLPEAEPVTVAIPPTARLEPAGEVLSVVGDQVVVESAVVGGADPPLRVLDAGSVLVFDDRAVLGRVFDTFGPVARPLYVVRVEPARAAELRAAPGVVGRRVFCVAEMASFALTSQVCQLQGSDASNMFDEEVGED